MLTEDIFTYALKILKQRADYYCKYAKETNCESDRVAALTESGAYSSAWWILWYAIHEQWDCLEQFDYINESED